MSTEPKSPGQVLYEHMDENMLHWASSWDERWRDHASWESAAAAVLATAPINTLLLEAAKAVVDRWDNPRWKDVPHTGEFIGRLRAAIASAEGKT